MSCEACDRLPSGRDAAAAQSTVVLRCSAAASNTGAAVMAKFAALTALPPEVVTLIGPVVAAGGTVAVICASLSTVKLDAAVPLKATALAPVKPVPARVTTVPTGPEVGRKLVTADVPARANFTGPA